MSLKMVPTRLKKVSNNVIDVRTVIAEFFWLKKTLVNSEVNIQINNAVILNQSEEISFEKTLLIIDDIELYQSDKKRLQILQAESLKLQINTLSKKNQAIVQQSETTEIMVIDTVIAKESFEDYLPTGFLPLLMKYAQQRDLFSLFDHLNFFSKEVEYTHLDKIKTILAAIACGCAYTKDINYKLKPYQGTARMLGLNSFPDQSQINRFLREFTFQNLSELDLVFNESIRLFYPRKKIDVLDVDATGLIAQGKTYEGNKKGYVTEKRGVRGYQLMLGYAHDYIFANFLDPGNTNAGARFWDSYYTVAETIGRENIKIVRADGIHGTGPNIQELIEINQPFIIRGYHPKTAKKFSKGIPEYEWSSFENGVKICDIGWQRITNCKYPVRVILQRYFKPKKAKTIYRHLYTNIDGIKDDETVWLYNGRVDIESMIDAQKNGIYIRKLKTRNYKGIKAFIYFACIVHNLITAFRQDVLSEIGLENSGIKEITRRLMDIPAKIGDKNEIIFPESHPMIRRIF